MASRFLTLTDDQLLDKVRAAGGEVMVGYWQDAVTHKWEAGIRNASRAIVIAFSAHDTDTDAEAAASELEARLDRLACERPTLTLTVDRPRE